MQSMFIRDKVRNSPSNSSEGSFKVIRQLRKAYANDMKGKSVTVSVDRLHSSFKV